MFPASLWMTVFMLCIQYFVKFAMASKNVCKGLAIYISFYLRMWITVRQNFLNSIQFSYLVHRCSVLCILVPLSVFLFRSLYSVYCLSVNVNCTAATGCQPNCSYIYIYINKIVSYHIISTRKSRESPLKFHSDILTTYTSSYGCHR
jgi:hypothetical protein